MLYILIAGGPGTGKTTLVNLLKRVLEDRGITTYVIRDWARELIREGKRGLGVPLPWTDREAFEIEVIKKHLNDFRIAKKYLPQVIIEDGGPIAPIAYCRVDGVKLPIDIVSNVMKHARRINLIVITELLNDYSTDSERWEERDYAIRIHKEIVAIHERIAKTLNIKLVKVPSTDNPNLRISYLANILFNELRIHERRVQL